jgi:hypothetical protein
VKTPAICTRLSLLLAMLALGGCSILSPIPTLELLKASGSATSAAVSYGPSKASSTVHHGDAPVSSLCIEYNRDAQAADLVPALQAELKALRIESRVYEVGAAEQICTVWLRYVASIRWDTPPLSSSYKAYVSAVSLSLHRSNGRLMASSNYALDESGLSMGKWSSTRSKVGPAVKALITGFEG